MAVPPQQVPCPHVRTGLRPGTWAIRVTSGAFGFLFGATTWREPLMAAGSCSVSRGHSWQQVPAPCPSLTHPTVGAGRRHSPLVEEENVDGPNGCHDPDDPAHVGGPGPQLPQVQPARPRAVVRGSRAAPWTGLTPSPPWLSHQRVFPTRNFNFNRLKSMGCEGFVERGKVQPRKEAKAERETLFIGTRMIFFPFSGAR